MDVGLQTVNISWDSLSLPLPLTTQDVNETFELSLPAQILSLLLIIQLDELSHALTSRNSTPPCEVYYISVLATYHEIAGVTYTGPGCGVSTSVIHQILPSLPNVSEEVGLDGLTTPTGKIVPQF